MGLWDDATNWIADKTSGYFVEQDAVDTARQVADAQHTVLDRQKEEGKVGLLEYNRLNSEIEGAGTNLRDYKEEHSDIAGIVPMKWKVIIASVIVLGLFFYLGGGNVVRFFVKKKYSA